MLASVVRAQPPGEPTCYGTQSDGEFWETCCDYDCGIFAFSSCSSYWSEIGCEYTNKATSYQCAGEDTTTALTFEDKEPEPDAAEYGRGLRARVVPDTDWCLRSSDCDPFLDDSERGCCLVSVDYERHPYKNNYEPIQKRTTLGCVCQQDASWFEYSRPYSGSFGCQTTSEANQVNMPMCDCEADSVSNPFGACVMENGAPRFFATCELSDDEECFSRFANSCLKCGMDRLTVRLYAGGGAGSSKWCWQEPDVLRVTAHGGGGCSGRYDEVVRASRGLATHVNVYGGCSWQWDGCSASSCWRYYDPNDQIPGGCSCFSNGCSEGVPDVSLGFCALDTCDWKDPARCGGFGFGSPPRCECMCRAPLDGPGCTLSDPEWCSEEGTVPALRSFPSRDTEADIVFCHCEPGYAGQRCERRGCSGDADCANGGTCLQSAVCRNNGTECWDAQDRTCLCTERFYGAACERSVECTREAYCNGNGECSVDEDDGGRLRCVCDYSFGGDRCEIYGSYLCDPSVGPTASAGCQGQAYCMDSENCEGTEFDPVSGRYVSALQEFETCADRCACGWRSEREGCVAADECEWVQQAQEQQQGAEETGTCRNRACREIDQISTTHVRRRRCELEPQCVYSEEEDDTCAERLFEERNPDTHVCRVTPHGTCKDSRTQEEHSCPPAPVASDASGGRSYDTCFETPDRFVRGNTGWTDFRLVFRGATAPSDGGTVASLSVREIMLLDEQDNQIGPWFGADGVAVNNWTVYCNTPHDPSLPESECWRMFDRDYAADTQLGADRFEPSANRTAPSNVYDTQYIKRCLDHWSGLTREDECYYGGDINVCNDSVACVPVPRGDGDVGDYAFTGTPFGYGACGASALGHVRPDYDSYDDLTGPGFVSCLVDEEGYTEDYSPPYYYGCWSGPLGLSDYYYTWRLDPDLRESWSVGQCSAGAFRTAARAHSEEQFGDGAVVVTLRTSDDTSVIPERLRILCDTEHSHDRAARDCPNRVELQVRKGAGSAWTTVFDSKSDPGRVLSTHRAAGLGRALTEADFPMLVPSETAPFEPLRQGFEISLDVSDAEAVFVPSRTYKYDTVEVLHYDSADVLVPSTEAWAYRVWEGCIDRAAILDRRSSGSSCVSELSFEGQCADPPCCRHGRCCAQFAFPPTTCETWENWCRHRTELQKQLDVLSGVDPSIGNTSSECAVATFQARADCVPRPTCECMLGWRESESGEDCAECDISGEACVNGRCGVDTNGVCVCYLGWGGPACTWCAMSAVCFGDKVCDTKTGQCVAQPNDESTYFGWYVLIVFLAVANCGLLLKCLRDEGERSNLINSKKETSELLKNQ